MSTADLIWMDEEPPAVERLVRGLTWLVLCGLAGGALATVVSLPFGAAAFYLALTGVLFASLTVLSGLEAIATQRLRLMFKGMHVDLPGPLAVLFGLGLVGVFGPVVLGLGTYVLLVGVDALLNIPYELSRGPIDTYGDWVGFGTGIWFAASLPFAGVAWLIGTGLSMFLTRNW